MSFQPYVNNGGTVVGIAGEDYCVIAADTRLSQGYSILTRKSHKMAKLTDRCIIATSGGQNDLLTLHKTLVNRIVWYKHQHNKDMSTPALAQLLSNTLYYRRFFPYYTFNLVGGLDEQGRGVLYGYDAIGSYQEIGYGCQGTGLSLIHPLLDNQVANVNQTKVTRTKLSASEAVALIKDSLTSAGERDIYTGDFVDISIITKDGIKNEKFELKFD